MCGHGANLWWSTDKKITFGAFDKREKPCVVCKLDQLCLSDGTGGRPYGVTQQCTRIPITYGVTQQCTRIPITYGVTQQCTRIPITYVYMHYGTPSTAPSPQGSGRSDESG